MQESQVCRILLVENHTIVRKCLAMLMDRRLDVEVVGEAENAEEALQLVETLRPDMVITDINLPDESGITLSREIRSRYPETRVLVLTTRGDDRAVISAILGGASGFLLKEIQSQQVIDTVRKAHRGAPLLDPELAKRVLQRVLTAAEEDPERKLTPDEQQILNLVSEGRNNQEIAEITSVTETTVKTRVNTIYGKLEVTRRLQSVEWRQSRSGN